MVQRTSPVSRDPALVPLFSSLAQILRKTTFGSHITYKIRVDFILKTEGDYKIKVAKNGNFLKKMHAVRIQSLRFFN